MSPRELNLLFVQDHQRARDAMVPAALICSVLANINRDVDSHPEPFTPANFMPGAKTEEDEMREFAEAVARGDKFEPDPEMDARFKQQMQSTFKNIVAAPAPAMNQGS